MNASNRRKPSGAMVAAVLILLLLAPILYFLSVGPMVVQLDRGEISKPTFDTTYLPLLALVRASPNFRALCEWYVDYWREKPALLSYP